MNRQLYNRKVKMPDTLKKHLEDSFNSVDGNSKTEGYNRNQQLRNTGVLTYQQLKRIKNWFDSFSGKKDEPSYILNGGDRMKNWTNYVLDHWRKTLKNSEEIKTDSGMDDEQPTTVDNVESPTANPDDTHKKSSEKYDTSISENIKRINKLIKIIK